MATVTLPARLATMLHYLNRGYTVNVKQLSEEFDIGERQIQKDIELFSDMYEIESLGSQNYKIAKGYKLTWFDGEAKFVTLEARGNAKTYIERKPSRNMTFLSNVEEMIQIEFKYYNEIEVLNFVKHWLAEVKIVDNAELKHKLQILLQEYLSDL